MADSQPTAEPEIEIETPKLRLTRAQKLQAALDREKARIAQRDHDRVETKKRNARFATCAREACRAYRKRDVIALHGYLDAMLIAMGDIAGSEP